MSNSLFEDMMDFIDAKFKSDEAGYSEVIGALSTLKTMYKAQWKSICKELANECDEDELHCDDTCENKLQ